MADIDVSAQGLAVPPQSAPQALYTPALSVRNEGIEAATATGYLRIWDKGTGVLLATHQIQSSELAPGETNNAASVDGTWDLTEVAPGTQFLIDGMVTCDGDQVSSNNPQGPVTVTVSDAEPPPPPPVEDHASQHETGGGDKINVDGLEGQLADPQQVSDHKATHENAGGDELNVAGLVGELSDPQPPKVHDNAAHDEDYVSEADLQPLIDTSIDAHNAGANAHDVRIGLHDADTDAHDGVLENVDQRDIPNGYPSLDGLGLVHPSHLGNGVRDGTKFLRDDSQWAQALPPYNTPLTDPPGHAPDDGSGAGTAAFALYGHTHGAEGPINRGHLGTVPPLVQTTIARAYLRANWCGLGEAVTVYADLWGQWEDPLVLGTLDAFLLSNGVTLATGRLTFNHEVPNYVFHFRFQIGTPAGATVGYVEGKAIDPGLPVVVESICMPLPLITAGIAWGLQQHLEVQLLCTQPCYNVDAFIQAHHRIPLVP